MGARKGALRHSTSNQFGVFKTVDESCRSLPARAKRSSEKTPHRKRSCQGASKTGIPQRSAATQAGSKAGPQWSSKEGPQDSAERDTQDEKPARR